MQTCSVEGCGAPAEYEVLLYDVYPAPIRDVFFEPDFTCPRLCRQHMAENEAGATGTRQPRGVVQYPFSNRHRAQGFTVYRPLGEEAVA